MKTSSRLGISYPGHNVATAIIAVRVIGSRHVQNSIAYYIRFCILTVRSPNGRPHSHRILIVVSNAIGPVPFYKTLHLRLLLARPLLTVTIL